MNIVDWFYAVLIVWSELNKVALSASTAAIVVAVLRMRKHGKVLWSEALLCGVFATITIVGLQFILAILGLPSDGWVHTVADGGSTVIGAGIGWYGTERTVEFLENKVGGRDEQESERD